jgi:probable F420-dependent oxidoreductase
MYLDAELHGELSEVRERADALHRAGIDGAFTFEGPRDVFFPLVAAGDTGLDLYTNVAIAFPRSPMHLAYSAYDLARLSEGRFALGLGSQIRTHIEKRYSAEFDRPVARLRELIAATRAIFAAWHEGVALDFRGDFYQHTLLPPTFNPGPLPWGPPPIWCGAMGPKMVTMVAGHADGLVLHPFNTSAFLADYMRPTVAAGLAAQDRTAEDLTMVGSAIICPYRNDAEQAAAESAVRTMLGFYGSTPAYRVVLDHHGWGELQPELKAMTKAGKWGELGAIYSEDQVDTLSIRGTPAEVGAGLVERFGGWAQRVALSYPGRLDPEILGEIVAAVRSIEGHQ